MKITLQCKNFRPLKSFFRYGLFAAQEFEKRRCIKLLVVTSRKERVKHENASLVLLGVNLHYPTILCRFGILIKLLYGYEPQPGVNGLKKHSVHMVLHMASLVFYFNEITRSG